MSSVDAFIKAAKAMGYTLDPNISEKMTRGVIRDIIDEEYGYGFSGSIDDLVEDQDDSVGLAGLGFIAE